MTTMLLQCSILAIITPASTINANAQTAFDSCLETKIEIEDTEIASNDQQRMFCTSCFSNNSPPGNNLLCTDACEFCQDDLSDGLCGRTSYGGVFQDNAQGDGVTVVQLNNVFRFNTGDRSETIFLQQDNCVPLPGMDGDKFDQVVCSTCSISVDGEACLSCSMEDCQDASDGPKAPSFDCSNIEPSAVYHTCPESRSDIAMDSVFEYWKRESGNFDVCFLGGRPQAPTVAPVETSPPTSINRVGCALQIGTQNCGTLLQKALNNTAVEG